MAEPTATNQQTGEKIVFRGGQWVPMTGAAPAPQPGGPVFGAPPKVDAPPTFQPPSGYAGGPSGLAPIPGGPADPNAAPPAAPSGYRYKPDGSLEPIPGGPEATGLTDPSEGVGKLARVIDQLDNIYADSADNGGWLETGTTGQMMRGTGLGGTPAFDLGAAIQTIDANMAFDALQRMREASPTGGALGQVTEKELALLKSTIANIDPNQSQDQFIRSLGEAKAAYLDMLRRLDPAKAEEIEKRGNPTVGPNGAITYDDRGAAAVATPPPTNGGGGFLGVNSFGELGQGIAQGTGDIAEGLGNLIGIVGAPVNATINAATGSNLSTDFGTALRETVGLPDNPNATTSLINQGATAAMTGSLAARGIAAATSPGTAQNVLSIIGRTPVRDAAAGAGASAGAVAGKASGVPGGELAGTLLGGLGGYGAASGGNALLRWGNGGQANALGQAAARQGVDLLPADAGGSATGILTSGAKASPLSAGFIRSAARNNQRQMKDATQRAVGERAEPVTTDKAGESIRGAAVRYRDQTSATGERLYTRAYNLAKGVVGIKPVRTLERLDTEIARLEGNPAAPEGAVGQLRAFRDKIANGVGIQGLRDARTLLGQGVYDGKLRSGAERSMWKGILGNIGEDIDAGLHSAGKGNAAEAFRAADNFWQQRVEHIDQVLEPLIGAGKGGEEIVAAVERMARGQSGGNARLSRLLSQMTSEEATGVRGTIIDRLGKATPGQQDAAGEAFSASTFLTNWNRLTPQAKASMFGDTRLRSDMNDLALLAENMKASQSMANHSNTAMTVAGGGQAIGAYAISAALHPVAAVLFAGSQVALGKLLASPGFARMLTRTAKMPPEQAGRKLSEQLGILAGREPLVAADARALQQWLQGAANNNALGPTRAVAGEQEQQQR